MSTDDIRAPHSRCDDFLGAFAVIENDTGILMVQNRRVVDGRNVLTWDLPGGQVERGESLTEALARELDEEIGVQLIGDPEFLFFQEGERVIDDARHYAWRSFFFGVVSYRGTPRPSGEIVDQRWMPRDAMRDELRAPYHDSFLAWLESGGRWHRSAWRD